MGYYDDPIVDENSKRSEESVNIVKSLFTRKNGFISREEIPDYGVDLDVELIIQGIGASSKKFAIQIKSSNSLDIITNEGIEYISLTFKTSRLGYLARREPGYGIVVIYEECSSTSYFDYVEDIIARLDIHAARQGWRERQTVNILIPLKKLETSVLPSLHLRYRKRFENSAKLLEEHGPKFNIPVLSLGTPRSDGEMDFKDPVKVAVFLEKHGAMLFNEHEFRMLHQMLGIVSKNVVDQSAELVFLAAITYTQVGQMIEAEYYIRKANKRSNALSEEKQRIIAFSQIRVDFLKGDIDYTQFLERFKALGSQGDDIENQLIIEVNILLFELVDLPDQLEIHTAFENRIAELFHKIGAADIPEDKRHLLTVYLSEVIHSYAIGRFMTDFTDYKIRESMGIDVPLAKRAKLAGESVAMIRGAVGMAIDAYKYAKSNSLKLLQATSQLHLGKYFFSFQYALVAIGQGEFLNENNEALAQSYITNVNYCLYANNTFQDLHMYQNAYEALGHAYNTLKLGHRLTGNYVGDLDPKGLLRIMTEMSNAFDFPPFVDTTEQFASLGKEKNERETLKDASDDKIEELARGALKVYDLPNDRLVNIVHEMKMIRTFQQKCNNPNIELLHDLEHTKSKDTFYASLPKCILSHRLIEFRTYPSSDIKVLLNQISNS